jgi:hypothetical protein
MIALLLADDRPARNLLHRHTLGPDRRQRREVPPDVTIGRVVVVVGATVVGVVGVVVVGATVVGVVGVVVGVVGVVVGAVDGELDAAPPLSAEPDEPTTGGTVVAGGDVVVVVAAVSPAPEPDTGDGAEAPGCSRATTTPRNAVAPPASTTNVWVSRRRRCCASARVAGEKRAGGRFMLEDPGGACAPCGWAHRLKAGS